MEIISWIEIFIESIVLKYFKWYFYFNNYIKVNHELVEIFCIKPNSYLMKFYLNLNNYINKI